MLSKEKRERHVSTIWLPYDGGGREMTQAGYDRERGSAVLRQQRGEQQSAGSPGGAEVTHSFFTLRGGWLLGGGGGVGAVGRYGGCFGNTLRQ